MVEALTPCTKQPQKQDVRFRQTTAAMLEVLTYTPSIAEVDMRSAKKTTHGRTYRALAGIVRMGFDRNLALGALPRHFAAKDSRKGRTPRTFG